MIQFPRAIISALLIKKDHKEIKIFIQTRWKKASPTYSGMIEIPAGCIDAYENVYDTLKREVKEECGLTIKTIIGDYRSPVEKPSKKDSTFVFKPFICQQALKTNKGLPWIGFVFLCEAFGKIKINKKEAKDPKWISVSELRSIIENDPKKIFPLQLPVLKYFLNICDKIF